MNYEAVSVRMTSVDYSLTSLSNHLELRFQVFCLPAVVREVLHALRSDESEFNGLVAHQYIKWQ